MPKKPQGLKAVEETREVLLGLKEPKLASKKKTPDYRMMELRAIVLRTMLQGLPGRTIGQKRKSYKKVYDEHLEELYDIFSIHRCSSSKNALTAVEQMAGVKPLWPSMKDALKGIARRGDLRGASMTTKECAKILEAAGMVEVAREGRNLTGIRILDRERFNRTLATGYVQWPELRPMPMEERGGGRRQRLFKGAIQK